MNELELTLQKILEKSIELAEQTGEFVIEQGSEVLQQFFLWHTVHAILGIVLSFILLTIGVFIPRIWGAKESFQSEYREDSINILGRHYDSSGSAIPVYFLLATASIAFLFTFCLNVYNLIFIIIVPKLYLLEYFL